MATTLTSSITEIDSQRLKKDLEAIGDTRVVRITPPQGANPTTVVLTKGDKISNLTPSQIAAAQAVIDAHIDYIDESVQELANTRAVLGTLFPGNIEFVNAGLAWKIDPNKNFLPIGSGRKLGDPNSFIDTIYVHNIIGATVFASDLGVYNEQPIGAINGINTVFSTVYNFVAGTTRVFLNGLRLTLGSGQDYTETGENQITLSYTLSSGDILVIDYVKDL